MEKVSSFDFRFQLCTLTSIFNNYYLKTIQCILPCSVTLLSMEEIHSASQDAANGLPSRRPIIEMTIPSVLDKTISPPGTYFFLDASVVSYSSVCFLYVVKLMGSDHIQGFLFQRHTKWSETLIFSPVHIAHGKDVLQTFFRILTLPAVNACTHVQLHTCGDISSLTCYINVQNAYLTLSY